MLKELADYLDGSLKAELRTQLEAHLAKCPNCWVLCDTTKKTIQVFKGMDLYPLPEDDQAQIGEDVTRGALDRRLLGFPAIKLFPLLASLLERGKPISYEIRNAINVWLRLRRAVAE